ncbi:MAG: L-aspartate oxidase [Planctomycetota bacterium]
MDSRLDSKLREPRFPERLGAFDQRSTPVLRTDVLVVGCGIAGGAAALHAADAGADVLVLSKGEPTESNTACAQGGIATVQRPDDSIDQHLRDTLVVGAGLSEPAVVEEVVRGGREALAWLEKIGVRFDREPDGSLALGREGGHTRHRVVHASGDATGLEIQRAIAIALQSNPRITCRAGSYVRDLLVHEGRCVGASVLVDGKEIAVEAGATVLAAGGAGQIYRETTNPTGSCGDGFALAFRAGARLCDLEFVQFHPTTLYIAGASRFLISEVVRGAGAILRDRNGDAFMKSVHPMADLAPRDIVARAILDRMVATGDTHVYLDLGTVDGNPHELFPSISRICAGFDIDIRKDPIPVRPGAHYFVGGVRTDRDGRTSLPALFACGETASTGLHGANRLASNSLLEGAVLGARTGRTASIEASSSRTKLPRTMPATPLPEQAPHILRDDLLYSLKSLMWRQAGLRRDEVGLQDALARIAFWNHYLMRAPVADTRSCELANILAVAALVTKAALTRRESRGTHFRNDHPERLDSEWCRHIYLQRRSDMSIGVAEGEVFPASDPPAPT